MYSLPGTYGCNLKTHFAPHERVSDCSPRTHRVFKLIQQYGLVGSRAWCLALFAADPRRLSIPPSSNSATLVSHLRQVMLGIILTRSGVDHCKAGLTTMTSGYARVRSTFTAQKCVWAHDHHWSRSSTSMHLLSSTIAQCMHQQAERLFSKLVTSSVSSSSRATCSFKAGRPACSSRSYVNRLLQFCGQFIAT